MGGSSKQTSTTTIDPAAMARATNNFDRTSQIADAPVTPYTGSLNLQPSIDTATGLLGYQAPQIAAAQLNRSNIRDVNAGSIGADQISQFMNPYLDQVVSATQNDLEHSRKVAQMDNDAKWGAATAFGNGARRAVQQGVTDAGYDRTDATTIGALRSQGFDTAVSAAQTEAARNLQAQLANQGVDVTVEQANAMLQQQTKQANQQADIASAGVRSGAAGLLGSLNQAQTGFDYSEFLRQQQDPIVKQQLLTQSLGAIPVPSSTTTKSSSNPGAAGLLGGLGSLAMGAGALGLAPFTGGLSLGALGGLGAGAGAGGLLSALPATSSLTGAFYGRGG